MLFKSFAGKQEILILADREDEKQPERPLENDDLKKDSSISTKKAVLAELINNTNLTQICDHINSKNRAAKLASMESNEWFRALYFKGNAVREDAVIFSLRSNAAVVFIPRFRIVDHVYLKEKDTGTVIIPEEDAERFGVSDSSPPTHVSCDFDEKTYTMV